MFDFVKGSGLRSIAANTLKASWPGLAARSRTFGWRLGAVALGLAAGLWTAVPLRAQTALSNLGQTLYGGNMAAGGYVNGYKFGDAVSFTTGPDAAYFTGASFPLFLNPATGYTAATGLEVSLNSGFGTSGSTGLLANLNGPSAPTLSLTPAVFSYTAASPILLAPDTRYWLQLDAFTTGVNTYVQWSATTDVGGIDAGGQAGWSYYSPGTYDLIWFFTNSGGSFWSLNMNPTAAAMFSVQFAPIPEPGTTAAAAGLAALGAIMLRRRRREAG